MNLVESKTERSIVIRWRSGSSATLIYVIFNAVIVKRLESFFSCEKIDETEKS